MKRMLIALAALTLAAGTAWAKAPPDATGECKDGTYTTSATKDGACSSHGGVKKWLAKSDKAEKADSKADKAGKTEKTDAKAAPEKSGAKKPAAEKAAAAKPADATGECKDGTYTTAATKSGACAGHKGVKDWYGKADAKSEAAAPAKSSAAPAKPTSSTTSTAPAAAPAASAPASSKAAAAPATAPASAAPSKTATTPPSERAAAAGGGAGKVWVNTDSKVYHCEKDALYGKTKQGEYMTQAQAKAMGARPARDKECS